MKTTLFSIAVTLIAVSGTQAQTPIIPRQVQINTPIATGNMNINFNPSAGLIKYDPAARVKYTFYDGIRFTEVAGRALPAANDYISLFTTINGKEYTIVPQNDISVAGSANGIKNMVLVATTGNARAAGVPVAPAMWKLTTIGGGLAMTYSGAFAAGYPEISNTPGGYLGFQSGQVKIAGGGAGITPYWQMQNVTEGGITYLRLQNTGDSKYLGFSYLRNQVAGNVVVGNFAVNDLATTGCPATVTVCDTKWFYKIYRVERITGSTPPYATPLEPNGYMVNVSYENRSLFDFGGIPVFGLTNQTSDEEQWRFEPTSRGTYFIFSKKTGKAMGVNKANRLVTAVVKNDDFYYTDTLQWVLKGPVEGRYTMTPYMNRATPNTALLLTCKDRGAFSIEARVEGSLYQQFIVTPPNGPLWGYMDMHTHPMSNFGFGGEFFFGACDGDPAVALGNCNCIHNYVVAPFDGSCGQQNAIRNQMIDFLDPHPKGPGYPDFNNWPKQSNTTHQQMWYEWVDRARRGGLRTIIALAQSSQTLADGMETNTANPYDDLRNMNKQIDSLITFTRRHPTIMDTVTTAARMREVVRSGRLAVIIGIEMDNIGNFYSPSERRAGEVYTPMPTPEQVKAEIDRLYAKGVRYIFPVHIVNNAFGSASLYGGDMERLLFNVSNYYDTGKPFEAEPVNSMSSGITFKYLDLSVILNNSMYKAVIDVIRNMGIMPVKSDVLDLAHYSYPNPGAGYGIRNKFGLTPLGKMAVAYMMSKGIMIDIDHMSEHSVSDALVLAKQFDYPVNSGHNGPRASNSDEKTRTPGQYDTLRMVGGMIGVGTGDAEASNFVNTFHTVFRRTNGRNITYGSDVGVGAKLPAAPSVAARLRGDIQGLPPNHTGNKTWDFNTYNVEGVDHYGLMPEFIRSLDAVGMTQAEKNALFSSTEYFAQMWEKCEINKRNVRL